MAPKRDQSESLLPALKTAIEATSPVGSTIPTVSRARPNRIVSIDADGVLVETERSLARIGGPELVEAQMLNAAWLHLTKFGTLTNQFLLHDLNVKRSSAVCALLARLPNVEIASSYPVVLALHRQSE